MNNQLYLKITTTDLVFDISLGQAKFYIEIIKQCKRIGDGTIWKIPSIRIIRCYPENPYKGLREAKLLIEWIEEQMSCLESILQSIVVDPN